MTEALPQIGQWSSLAELERLQDRQLPQSLEWASRSPFYQARLGLGAAHATMADLARMPLTSKQDLRDSYPFGMLAVSKERLATYHESSGTTGQPTASFYTARDWVDVAERFARKWPGIGPSDTLFVRVPYAMGITGHMAHAAGWLRGATVVPGDHLSLAMPYSRVIRLLHDLGVTLAWSVPTDCLIWAAAAKAAGYEPAEDFPTLRALFVGGEPLSPARRRRISRLWGVPVVNDYGSTETGGLAGECPAGSMHLWADRAIFEVYDPSTGRFDRQGTGQLVVTTLYHEAMPLVRYNIEDTVEVSYAECECDWHLPTIRVLGRTASGRDAGRASVTPQRLEALVFDLPEEYEVLFWRARAEPAALQIQIEVAERHRAAASVALDAAVRRELGVACEVSAVSPGTIVPREVLTRPSGLVKPRTLLGAGEDWTRAVVSR
jgi:phenylacetate-CoA ligase